LPSQVDTVRTRQTPSAPLTVAANIGRPAPIAGRPAHRQWPRPPVLGAHPGAAYENYLACRCARPTRRPHLERRPAAGEPRDLPVSTWTATADVLRGHADICDMDAGRARGVFVPSRPQRNLHRREPRIALLRPRRGGSWCASRLGRRGSIRPLGCLRAIHVKHRGWPEALGPRRFTPGPSARSIARRSQLTVPLSVAAALLEPSKVWT
jgi:hypothetical protein